MVATVGNKASLCNRDRGKFPIFQSCSVSSVVLVTSSEADSGIVFMTQKLFSLIKIIEKEDIKL